MPASASPSAGGNGTGDGGSGPGSAVTVTPESVARLPKLTVSQAAVGSWRWLR